MATEENREYDVMIVPYRNEEQLPAMKALIDRDLSEPYSIFTYRYFIIEWPHLCFLAVAPNGDCVGSVVSKLVRSSKLQQRSGSVNSHLPPKCTRG
jgi:hypothetical protein